MQNYNTCMHSNLWLVLTINWRGNLNAFLHIPHARVRLPCTNFLCSCNRRLFRKTFEQMSHLSSDIISECLLRCIRNELGLNEAPQIWHVTLSVKCVSWCLNSNALVQNPLPHSSQNHAFTFSWTCFLWTLSVWLDAKLWNK